MIGFSLAEAIVGIFSKSLDKFVVDKDKREEFLKEIRQSLLDNEAEIIKASSANVKAEIEGQSWLQRCWRPMFMMVGVFIIFNNFIIAPYVHAFTGFDLMLNVDTNSIPDQMWDLLNIGMGGYIIGRSAEKIAQNITITNVKEQKK